MKAKLFLIFSLLLAFNNVSAQDNINVDNLRFSYWIRSMPNYPRNPVVFYYYTKIDMPDPMWDYMNVKELDKNLYITGQKYTSEPKNANYTLTGYVEPINIISSEIKERYKEEKDSKGNMRRIYYFWLEVGYNIKVDGSFSKEGKTIRSYNVRSRSNKIIYKSTEYETERGARHFWRDNRDLIIEQLTQGAAMDAMSSLRSSVSRDFGFPYSGVSTLIKTMNTKKHPENDKVRAASNRLKSIMDNLEGTEPPSQSELDALADYFKSIPKRYTYPKLKADIRLRYIAYYNLCRIYIFMDQPDNVRKYADLLYENGFDTKDRDRLIEDANRLRDRLGRSFFKRSQFTADDYFK